MKASRSNKTMDERYAQNIVAGMGQHEAYLAAGFAGNSANASRKAAKPVIQQRVSELRRKLLSKFMVDQEWVTQERVKTYHRAVDAGDGHVCQKILKDLASNLGMDVRKTEISIHASYERKTDAELLQELRDIMLEASEQLQITDQSESDEAAE